MRVCIFIVNKILKYIKFNQLKINVTVLIVQLQKLFTHPSDTDRAGFKFCSGCRMELRKTRAPKYGEVTGMEKTT